MSDLVERLERYDPFMDSWGDEFRGMKQHPAGDWVKFEDAATALAQALKERDEARAERNAVAPSDEALYEMVEELRAGAKTDLSMPLRDLLADAAACLLGSITERNKERARAEAAESKLSQAAKALGPFANMMPDSQKPKNALQRKLQEWCREARRVHTLLTSDDRNE